MNYVIIGILSYCAGCVSMLVLHKIREHQYYKSDRNQSDLPYDEQLLGR